MYSSIDLNTFLVITILPYEIYGEVWWGRPDLNRRPLPKNRAKQFFTGFFMTAPEIRHSPRGVSKPVCVCFLEPVVIPA